MEVETLVEWVLRRREEMTRAAAAGGVVKHAVEYLKRKRSERLTDALWHSTEPSESKVGFAGHLR